MDVNGFLPQQRTARECRQRAEGCSQRAALTKDESIRAMLVNLADQWTFIANQIERFEARERSALIFGVRASGANHSTY
jgi:hypothetical protein